MPMREIFHEQVRQAISKGEIALRDVLIQWEENLNAIADGREWFNHWDDDNAWLPDYPNTSDGWALHMLDFSRREGNINFIQTNNDNLDFTFLSHGLILTIPGRNNRIRPGHEDSLEMEGLGIRSNGTFCIVEVKAVNEHVPLLEATIQTLFYAVAIYAKREMIIRLARPGRRRRPAAPLANIPDNDPSLGLYVMVDAQNYHLPQDAGFRDSIGLLKKAFPPLREVAYFAVDPG